MATEKLAPSIHFESGHAVVGGGSEEQAGLPAWVDFRFTADQAPTCLNREVYGEDPIWQKTRVLGIARTSATLVTVAHDYSAVCLIRTGTMLVRAAPGERVRAAAPGDLMFVRGPSKFVLVAVRGEHVQHTTLWRTSSAPAVEQWLSNKFPGPGGRLLVRSLSRTDLLSFERNGVETHDNSLPALFARAHLGVALVCKGSAKLLLAPIESDFQDTVQGLVRRVRLRPQDAWPLRESAALAGYSPFHFSRLFKQMVGFGFHEFVDRCRTELAVEYLTTTSEPIDRIATLSGFGATQGLRESLKDYLGIVPSDLRSVPDGAGAFTL